ncbi:MAG: ABC transporter permease [Propionibacteriaceae bacterium]|jgi:ABC-type transport system involved in multi-copper enzyme maturation permease subunit|nr:ABC transporter permease [Propionibacteriaceae bacterium]
MIAVITAEFRKFFTTRMWWVMLLITVGYSGLMAAGFALLFDFAVDEMMAGSPDGAAVLNEVLYPLIYPMGAMTGFIFPVLVGAMSVTGEFRHQTITGTFLAEPRRWRSLTAKLIASLPLGLIYGAATTLACVGCGGGLMKLLGYSAGLDKADTWEVIGRSVWTLVLWTVVGVGFGLLLKNQVASIVVVLAFTQLVEPLLQMIPLLTGVAMPFLSYLPMAAGNAVAGGNALSALGDDSGGNSIIVLLSAPVGSAVLLAYGLVFAAIGYFVNWRRDVS